MATPENRKEASIKEMLVVLGPLLSQPGTSDDLSIPGMNAYVPSYAADGTGQRRGDGQLEPDS
jgi:hypothetical protein